MLQAPSSQAGAAAGGAGAAALPLPAHTWTGDAACYVPRPAQPPAIAGTTAKPGHTGTWLRAAAPARLRVVAGARGGGAAAALELSLPKQLLLRRDLPAAEGCGGGNGGLGAAVFCFRFYDAQECATFQSSIGELKSEAERALRASERAASAAAAGRHSAGPGGGGAGHSGAGGAADAAAAAGLGDPASGSSQSDGEIRAAIWSFLSDPSFASYVTRVEALWDEVEAEVGGGGSCGGGGGGTSGGGAG
ncbi:hypothetical protein Rsub_13065 [Raphidocelis subcapitata]|uniref:Uncharacterized protein n=1 Tax=Raphidocelis subcapitata TaxID=307507 RepID=A0A2V0PMI8_9CHLO|nr:hypothetical protein Rsub_13065 [Raphidocelis subcapitata]|eukprot:GBG00303.1 hypothetical protein Rsub_13065 [Raphidocelis subcapitata]